MKKCNREIDQFFRNLHQNLAAQYNITPYLVVYIRSEVLGLKRSRKEIAETLVRKLQYYSAKRLTPKKHLQPFLNFVASCSEEVWKDITQKTKFDK